MDNQNNILAIKDMTVTFGGLKALDNVNIEVKENTVHGIIGPNGAGKTTLFNSITGLVKPDIGKLIVEDVEVKISKPNELVNYGISRTFQNIRLFDKMTVLENVMIGNHIHSSMPILSIIVNGKKARESEKLSREYALEALKLVGIEDLKDEIAGSLAYGQQRLVEFARAIAAKPKVILLDEPAAGMNPSEKTNLLNIINNLKSKGYTFILIEHDMKLVMNICSNISVLDYGKIISQGNPEDVRKNPAVIKAYLGEAGEKNVRNK